MTRGITIVRGVAIIPAILFSLGAWSFRPLQTEPWPFGPGILFALAVAMVLSFWFVLCGGSRSQRILMAWSSLTAIALAGVGTIAGMAFAMFRWPTSNLAPIMGIFQTGPICFSLGACLGAGMGVVALHVANKKMPNIGVQPAK